MAGRKPLPTHLKILRGNPGKRPLNKHEPKFAEDLPEPPGYLSDRSRNIFVMIRARLESMGYASSSHTEALTLIALRLEEVELCTETLNAEGLTQHKTDDKGNVTRRARPEVVIRHEAAKHAQSLLAEFGLTPSSATKVIIPSKQPTNAFQKFK